MNNAPDALKEALEIGLDLARAYAADVHTGLKGYKPEKHTAADDDVRTIEAAIASLAALLAQDAPVRDERAAFEKFAIDRGYPNAGAIHPVAWDAWQARAALAQPLTSAAPAAPQDADRERLDALTENSWKLDPFERPTGGDDSDIGWRVVQYRMDKPHERTVAEVYEDDPRAAIDAARKAKS